MKMTIYQYEDAPVRYLAFKGDNDKYDQKIIEVDIPDGIYSTFAPITLEELNHNNRGRLEEWLKESGIGKKYDCKIVRI